MILLKSFCAKMVNAIFSTMVAKTQRYERFVIAFSPAASAKMVKFDWSRLMVAINVVAKSASEAGNPLLVFALLVSQCGLRFVRTTP